MAIAAPAGRSSATRRSWLALAVAVGSAQAALAAPCHEIWNLASNQVQVFQAPSVDNPRSLREALSPPADADFHFVFTGTAVTRRDVVPYGSGPVARLVEQVNLSAVHGVRFDGKPLRLKIVFGQTGPGISQATVVAAPATTSSDEGFILGVDAAELWSSAAGDLMLDLCIAVAGTSSTVGRVAYQVEVLADSNLFLERLRPTVDVLRRGDSTRVTVKLQQAATQDTRIEIAASDPSLVEVPRSVTIPAGKDSAEFEIRCIGEPDKRVAVQILAMVDGSGQTAELSIEPGRPARR
jgi:hypothetical protein